VFAEAAALPPTRAARAWVWLRGLVLVAGIGLLAFLAWDQTETILSAQPLGIDFLPMWAAAHEAFLHHPDRIYDFAKLTAVQQPLLDGFPGFRPFVYPPPALLVFAPFGLLRFGLANAIWTAVGLALILGTTASQLKSPRLLVLAAMVLSPASVLVLITGQVTFLMATLAVTGLLSLKQRPLLAGVLFGLACAIKPQSLVLLPVALVATGQWRAVLAAGATAALAVAASIGMLGVHAWVEWLAALQRFQDWVMNSGGFQKGMITPTALGITLRLDAAGLATWRLGFAIGAVAMVWHVFRKTEDPARRLTALMGGSLFISPYAMHYDAALLAPAAALMLTHRSSPGQWIAALGAGALLCCAAIPYVGAAAVTAFVLVVSLTPETAFTPRRPQTAELPAGAAG
jgi:hypothetical protein